MAYYKIIEDMHEMTVYRYLCPHILGESNVFDLNERKQFGIVVSQVFDTGKTEYYYLNYVFRGSGVLNDKEFSP